MIMPTRGWVLGSIALGACLAAASACSSSDDSVSDDMPYDAGFIGEHCDGGTAKCAQPAVEAGEAQTPACYDVSGLPTITGALGVAHRGVCTSAQIDGFGTACLAAADTSVDASTDGGSACDAFVADNAACAQCIEGGGTDDGGAPLAPVLLPSTSGDGAFLDYAGCVAAVAAVDDACKESVEAQIYCEDLACQTCPQADAQTCLYYAEADAYCTTSYPIESTCLTTVNAADGSGCVAGSTFASDFQAIATTLCGP